MLHGWPPTASTGAVSRDGAEPYRTAVEGSGRLQRRLLAGLLPDDVLGIPVRPVVVILAGPLLVLAMRHGCAPHRGGEVGRRAECRAAFDAAGQLPPTLAPPLSGAPLGHRSLSQGS